MRTILTLNKSDQLEAMLLIFLNHYQEEYPVDIVIHDGKPLSNKTLSLLKNKKVNLIYEDLNIEMDEGLFLLKPKVLNWYSKQINEPFLFLDCDVIQLKKFKPINNLVCDQSQNPPEKTKIYHKLITDLNNILAHELYKTSIKNMCSSWIIGGFNYSAFWEEWLNLSTELNEKARNHKNPVINYYGQHYNEELALSILVQHHYFIDDAKTLGLGSNCYFYDQEDVSFIHYDYFGKYYEPLRIKEDKIIEKIYGIKISNSNGKLYEYAQNNDFLIQQFIRNQNIELSPDIKHLFSGFLNEKTY